MPQPDEIPAPYCVRWLVELVGYQEALALVECYGGTRLEVPKKISARSEIIKTTGLAPRMLQTLARERGGERIKMPFCREWRIRVYRLRDGLSYAQIARRVGTSEDNVWRVLREGGMTSQLELAV